MKNVYHQFNFERFKPKKLAKLAREVSLDSSQVQPDADKLQRLMNKLQNEEELRNSEVKFLCFFVSSIKKEGLFRFFYVACERCLNKEVRVQYHARGLLSSFYNDFLNDELYILLRYAIVRNIVWKLPLSSIKDFIVNSTNSSLFLEVVIEQFKRCKNFGEINLVKKNFLIQEHHLIFNYILLIILKDWILSIRSLEDFVLTKEIIDSFKDINIIKPAIESFLLSQGNRQDFDSLPLHLEEMFKLIGEKLGDAYGTTRNRWQGISDEAKRIFTLWKAQKAIRYFFGEIIGDPARLAFWKNYSQYIYRIDYFKDYDGAILMETNKHLFIEFADKGAMHMHDLKNLTIDSVKQNPHGYGKTRMISSRLKNKTIAITHLSHRGNWQWDFEWEMKKHGYEMRR